MTETVAMQVQVLKEWAPDLKDPTTLLEILGLGMEEYHIRRALALYQTGAGSLGYVAELAGIPKRVLMEHACQRGVPPHLDERLINPDLRKTPV